MKCKGCGSDLTLIEYQARSADEAHSSSYRCPWCPLDITKFSSTPPKPHLYLKRSKRTRKRTPKIYSDKSTTSRLLYITSSNTSVLGDNKLSGATCVNCINENSDLFKWYSTGPWKNKAIHYKDKKRIGLNAYIISISSVYTDIDDTQSYTDFKYATIEGYIVLLQDNMTKLVHDVGTQSDSAILEHLCIAYTIGFDPSSLSSYVSRILLGAMSNMNARAYDATSGEDYKDKFSTKPDGERMWLVRAGSTWLYCKRLNFEVRGWEIDNTLRYIESSSICPVVDIEFMLTFNPILIDVLLTSDMKVCPYDRDLRWIESQMLELQKQFGYLSVVDIREFFDTYDEAYAYSKQVEYPTDGVVAIPPHGTDMKKLKPVKSIELRLQENGNLVTKEGMALFQIGENSTYSTGDIIEIRFSVCDNKLVIHESFHRPDKSVPNDNSAVRAVIASCTVSDSDSLTRTMMWRWSNKLRFYLYEKANSMSEDRNIVLDIGSGSGQSTEAFDRLPGCSFVLVEPDQDSCKSLARRLGIRDIHKDPRSVIGMIPQLKRGTKRYHILNCRLESILSDKPVVSNLRSIVKCAVSCFSAHYVMSHVDDLISLGIPFVGCYYSYEGIEIGQSIINTSGIQMTRTSTETAIVKWGRDKAYDEPVVLSESEPLDVIVVDALDVISLDSGSTSEIVHKACSHVKIIISR